MRAAESSVLLAAGFALAGAHLPAQEAATMSHPVTVPHTEAFELRSRHAETAFQVWVAHPVAGMWPLPPSPRRVVYVLDANLFFGTAVDMTRLMSQLYGELPPLLVVGVGYDAAESAVLAELRARDFTPTVDPGIAAMATSMPGAPEPTLPQGRRLGRASRFLDFLTEELQPIIRDRYDVTDDGATLFGSSLGGLFVLHAALARPEAFDAYVAVSPAIWWDDRTILEAEAAYADAHDDLAATLFLAVGSEEERPDIPALAPFRMVSNVSDLVKRLRSRDYPSLRLEHMVADGESHTSVVPVALTRGLRHVHGGWRSEVAPPPRNER